MDTVLMIVHVVVAAALIGLVLLQQGKGADMGAAFGSGASQTVFGARGSGTFLTRTTAILATVFFITSLTLAYFSGQSNTSESVVDQVTAPAQFSDGPAPDETVAPPDVPAVPEDVPVAPVEEATGDTPPAQ